MCMKEDPSHVYNDVNDVILLIMSTKVREKGLTGCDHVGESTWYARVDVGIFVHINMLFLTFRQQ